MPAGQIDQFMAALSGVENTSQDPNAINTRTGAHGLFQIMPSNWASWAEEAGLPADAPKTADNQHRVARSKMLDYYNQFGRWDAVAVAWFAGPGRAQRYVEGDDSVLGLSDGDITVAEYLDRVNTNMGDTGPLSGAPGGGSQPLQTREGDPAGGQLSDPQQTRVGGQGDSAQSQRFEPDTPAGQVGEDGDVPDGRRQTAEARDAMGTDTDSRQLLTTVLQSVSDQIAGRGGTGGMFPDMGGPEPVAVPPERLPESEDALDGLGEQGGGTAIAAASGQAPQQVEQPGEEQPEAQQVAQTPDTSGTEPRGEPAPGGWVMPTTGRWSSNYGQDRGDHKHGGVDIATPEGTVVKAAKPGTVSRSGYSRSYGYVVYIDHPGGLQTRYAHLVGPPPVNVGDSVEAGQPIANTGNTGQSEGPHLHFEIRRAGQTVDPSARYGINDRFTQV